MIKEPQDILQDHLNGINEILDANTLHGPERLELVRYKRMFTMAIKWIYFIKQTHKGKRKIKSIWKAH